MALHGRLGGLVRTTRRARNGIRIGRKLDQHPRRTSSSCGTAAFTSVNGSPRRRRSISANSGLEKGRDDGDIATAYFHYSAKLLGRIARVLGDAAAAQRYEALAENIRSAWWTEYGNDDGSLRRPTQANYVRALAFGLAPDEKREKVAQRLVDLIRASGTHVGTGTFGTAFLLPVLADAGHADVAYELLLQDTPPSWMTMIDRGATTIWEMWDGVDEKGKAHFSLNHFSLGSVISFMHTHIAGIRLGQGFTRISSLSCSARPRR